MLRDDGDLGDSSSMASCSNMSTQTEDDSIPVLGLPRVGIVCDLLLEHWASMDLVGDMLLDNLKQHHSSSFVAERLRPARTKHFLRSGRGPEDTASIAERAFNRFVRYPLWLSQRKHKFDLFHVV